MGKGKKAADKGNININEMIALEEELQALKEEHGIEQKKGLWIKAGDWIADRVGRREPVGVNRRMYIKLAVFTGWLGGHRFYSKQYKLGLLYLLFFWSGVPFCMTVVDLMIALPMKTDEDGRVFL